MLLSVSCCRYIYSTSLTFKLYGLQFLTVTIPASSSVNPSHFILSPYISPSTLISSFSSSFIPFLITHMHSLPLSPFPPSIILFIFLFYSLDVDPLKIADPETHWNEFIKEIKKANDLAPQVWNPITKKLEKWIDIKNLESSYNLKGALYCIFYFGLLYMLIFLMHDI